MSDHNKFAIISGCSCEGIAEEIIGYFNSKHSGDDKKKLIKRKSKFFKNGEPDVEIEETVRGRVIFFIQTSLTDQFSQNLMETMAISDALYRAGAKSVYLVQLVYPGGRQERRELERRTGKPRRRPITAKIVADMLVEVAGIKGMITVHLHAEAIEGFFERDKCLVENINPAQIFIDHLKAEGIINGNKDNIIVLAPDAGAATNVSAIAEILGVSFGIVDKRRTKPGESEAISIIGNVEGKTVLLLDDMVDSGGTASKAAKKAMEMGAKEIFLIATHAVLTEGAVKNLIDSSFDKIIFTNTIPLPQEVLDRPDRFTILSVGAMLADVIANIYNDKSLEEVVKLHLEDLVPA